MNSEKIDKNQKKYNQYSRHLQDIFNCKVYKITLDAGFDCPNRDGTISHKGCIFCDSGASFSQAHSKFLPIEQQLEQSIKTLKNKFKAEKFISYFQAFTNTYASVEKLKNTYDRALSHPDIVGISIGTRPDCVDEEKLDLIQSYNQKFLCEAGVNISERRLSQLEGYDNPFLVWVEYGLQSIHNKTLNFLNRGHSFEDFVKAVELSQERGINVCAHVIIGLPGETKKDMLETAKVLADMNINGIKIHLLCVLKGTALETLYNNRAIEILSMEEYVEIVCDFLEILPPSTSIHRLAGNGLKKIRVAPVWLNEKFKVLNMIDRELEKRNSFQGKYYIH